MTDLDDNRSASYLTATADNAPQLGDHPDPAAPAHDGEADSSLWQRLKSTADALQWQQSKPALLLKAALFYLDFVSDVLYAILLRENPDLVGPSNVVISVLVLPPLALSAMDLYEYYKLPKTVQRGDGWALNPQRAGRVSPSTSRTRACCEALLILSPLALPSLPPLTTPECAFSAFPHSLASSCQTTPVSTLVLTAARFCTVGCRVDTRCCFRP